MDSVFSPYSDQNILGFFGVLFCRLWAFFTGKLPLNALATDEIQILVLSMVAISSTLVGTFLVLRRQTMLANALSHTILLGIVCAYLLFQTLSIPVLMLAALASGLATTFLTEFLTRVIHLQEDASVGLVFSIFFALGIVLITFFSRNVHLGTELVMGNVDVLQKQDLKIVGAVLAMNASIFFLLFHGFKITTFDQNLARSFGFPPLFFNYLLMVQTSATAIGAFRAVGVFMVLAFLVLPPLTARLLTNRLDVLIWIASLLGVIASIVGVALSRHLLTFFGVGLSTGGIVVLMLGLIYFLVVTIKWLIDISPRARYHVGSNASSQTHEKNCYTR